MKCLECGKEIPDGENNICDDCKKTLLNGEAEESKQDKINEVDKEKKKNNKKIIIIVSTILILILATIYIIITFGLISFNKSGNSIGNIRNYGYTVEKGNKIYFIAPDQNEEKLCIYKANKDGTNKEILLSEEWDLYGLNIFKNYLYFIAINGNSEMINENDNLDNKIYKMKIDGTDLQVVNDNQLNNDSYEIYVIDNKIYYTGLDANIYTMDLDGNNKKVINSDGTGFLGITDKYIIFNEIQEDENRNSELVTCSMNLDGSNRKVINGDRLYSVNIIDDEVYYVTQEMQAYKVNLATGENIEISKTSTYNMNISNNMIYFMNYCNDEGDIGIYKMNLDGSNIEQLCQLDSYSSFLNVIDDMVVYADKNEERKVLNIFDCKTNQIINLCEYIEEK